MRCRRAAETRSGALMQAPHVTPPSGWPRPSAAALEHSSAVAAQVRESLREAGGAISFAEYMRLVLYAPGLGY